MTFKLLSASAGTHEFLYGSRHIVWLVALATAGFLLNTYPFHSVLLAQARASENIQRIQLTPSDVPGYSLTSEEDRDWLVFDAEQGAPAADCLKAKPIVTGREQIWKNENAASDAKTSGGVPVRPSVRVDYAWFDSPGQAASAARVAEVQLSSATAKMADGERVGDASWHTMAGLPKLIVQRGAAVIYLSALGDPDFSEAQLLGLARVLVGRIDAIKTPVSAAQLACDVETYIGLGLIPDTTIASTLRSQSRQLTSASDNAATRRSVASLTDLIQANIGKGIDREAAVNLLRSAQALAEAR